MTQVSRFFQKIDLKYCTHIHRWLFTYIPLFGEYENIPGKSRNVFWQVFFLIFEIFTKSVMRDGLLIATLKLQLLMKTNRLYLKNFSIGNDSRTPLVLTEIGMTCRYSDVIYDRRNKTSKYSLVRMYKIDYERSNQSLMAISAFIFELLR